MKREHIIQVSSYYPPHLGGQENAVADLSEQLAADDYHVHVVTSAIGGGPAGTHIENGVYVTRLRGIVFGHAPIMPRLPVVLLRSAWPNTIVHIHIGQAFTPEMVWLISKLRSYKYIAELHIDFERSSLAGVLLPLYKRLILKRVLQSAHSIIALNENTLHTVDQVYGCGNKAYIMNNGIDEVYFGIQRPALAPQPPQPLRLLFVGRLSKQKNILALLRAIAMTKRPIWLDVLGDGEELDAVQKTISAYSLKNVIMHGRLARNEVIEFYKTCDALILPSLYEAQPLVLLEAMAARIPIIGTNVVGVADHIRGAGILVEPSPEGLADGIEQYYARYSLLSDMVERGYAIADKLRWHNTLKKYEGLYETVLGS